MAKNVQQTKVPKGGKNVQRGNRQRDETARKRPIQINHARGAHLKHARQSCGEKFALALQLYYVRIGWLHAPKKAGKNGTTVQAPA